MTARDILPQTLRAAELYGDFWFNSEPIPISALRGQVILLEFWDYSSVSSIRTLPYLKEWGSKYMPYGLVVVGVHTPRFSFGRDPSHVEEAIRRYGITFPVVTDNEGMIAARYQYSGVPVVVIIDKDGFVRYQTVGEGNYVATERALQALLHHAGVGEQLPSLMEPVRDSDRPGAILYRSTPDLLTGYVRGSIGNVEGFSPESVVGYTDPGLYLSGRFYIDGPWLNARDCIQLCGESGKVILDYEAIEVNAVAQAGEKAVVEATVLQDERPLAHGECGDDVRVMPDGRSVLTIRAPRNYQIVRNNEHGRHVLRLELNSRGTLVYGFAFVSGAMSEVLSSS